MTTHLLANFIRAIIHRVGVVVGAVALTLACFLVLPLMQTIAKAPETDLVVQSVDTADIPPPPPPPEEEPEEEEKPEDQPPELSEEAPPLDLSQLEMALNPGFSEGWLEGDFAVKLNTETAVTESADALFSLSDLDQTPRAIHQPSPAMDARVRRKAPGTVYVIFVVDERGRVENPIVQNSSDPIFDAPALAAIKQWKFEPGMRNGQSVRFRMRVPITFPKGQ